MMLKSNVFLATCLQEFYECIFPEKTINPFLFFMDKKDDESLDETINPSKTLWFRGQTNYEWPLQPSLYRKVKKIIKAEKKEIGEFEGLLLDRERLVFDDFKTRAYHLVKNPNDDNPYLWMSLMQHYGVATRLLDWSEEVNSALFFALEKYLWVLNPYKLWFNAVNYFINCGEKITEIKKQYVIQSLLKVDDSIPKGSKHSIYESLPIPVIAPYTHERIRAQTGTFVLFPKTFPFNEKFNISSSQDLSLETIPYSQDCLIQIVFTKPWQMVEELISIGLKRSLVYPELPNVSAETQQKFLRENKGK
jgi:hypothetical protein